MKDSFTKTERQIASVASSIFSAFLVVAALIILGAEVTDLSWPQALAGIALLAGAMTLQSEVARRLAYNPPPSLRPGELVRFQEATLGVARVERSLHDGMTVELVSLERWLLHRRAT